MSSSLLCEPLAIAVGRTKFEGGDELESGRIAQARIAVCVGLPVLIRDAQDFFRHQVARRIDVTLGFFAAAAEVARDVDSESGDTSVWCVLINMRLF